MSAEFPIDFPATSCQSWNESERAKGDGGGNTFWLRVICANCTLLAQENYFLVFPSKLTEEETMLQAKYAKLRKKKRQLAASKNPDAAEKAEKEAAKKAAATANAKDAKEVAKKLIRTGALPKIQKVSIKYVRM